ncbi:MULTISPECIES: anthranilate phosphoribosyltransferase [Idiomarina]|uniref:anthranilate phosphoribosyltransferase n=1 Tax=Idiomarina TaxID=135575 RepID=UPI00129CE61D|nr:MULTISPECIES: anthranilate phosphoribosyltransferase [Idiomarina]MRJ42282.1 anthranilate phosphoribosyltransferase [Idiomarina sp. FeN1]NCU57407.1 anthranilate phosphoribosyltransferase [Idiomarina sp. FenA--70]NCU60593.1 anthranilate phosphoribosyltransferase [Idiomarina sp. FenBw--71]UUN14768.1 anthranilate phosphoribosyltransferase [Idiomarina loihiensis]
MQAITDLMAGKALSVDAAERLFDHLVKGELNDIQITAALVAMKMRGEQPSEMAGAAQALRRAAKPFQRPQRVVIDSCGTGGDGSNTMNISTTAALVAASMGLTVAKHGNRSVSSRSGSADVLESLGLSVTQDPEVAAAQLDRFNFCFLFAPHYHPGIRYAMPSRQTLKTRTLFNLLGPLVNPAQPDAQLLGVYDPSWCKPMAETLRMLGCKRAMVVHGSGLDEIAIHANTHVVELRDGELTEYQLTPQQLGVQTAPISALRGGDADFNAQLLQRVLQGQASQAQLDAVAVAVAGMLYLSGVTDTIAAGCTAALEHLASGKALAHLHKLQEFNREYS